MENNNPSNRIHPLIAGAAVSVMLVSLTGVAAITGLIPNSHSTAAPATADTPVTSSANAATGSASPTATLAEPKSERSTTTQQAKASVKADSYAPRTAEAPQSQPRKTYNNAPAKVAQAPTICHSCGRVESVRAIEQAAQPSGVGMVAGAVLGGVLGNQVGGGSGRKIATVAGAVGGGYAGNEIEKRTRSTTSYQVRVRMEDGEIRTFPYTQQPGWNIGDRVRVVDGHLAARA